MLSLIVLVAAALLTSSSAASSIRRSATGSPRKTFRNMALLHIGAGTVALGSVLLAVHIQLGAVR